MPDDEDFDLDQHGKLHVLSGGTKVVQHSPPLKTSAGLKGMYVPTTFGIAEAIRFSVSISSLVSKTLGVEYVRKLQSLVAQKLTNDTVKPHI